MGLLSLIFRIGADKTDFNRTLRSIPGDVKRASGEMAKSFASGFGTIGRLGSLLGVSFGASQLRNVAKIASSFKDMSERTGVGVETLQELDFALKQSGSSAEAVEKVFKKLARARQEALADPKGATAAKLGALGIGVNELKSMRDAGDLFFRLSEAVEQTKLDANSLPLILDLIGDKNAEVLPAMAAGLRSAAMEGRRLNAIIGEDMVETLAALDDQIDNLALSMRGPLAAGLVFILGLVDNMKIGLEFFLTKYIETVAAINKHNPFASDELKQGTQLQAEEMRAQLQRSIQANLDRNDPEKQAAAREERNKRAGNLHDFNLDALLAGVTPAVAHSRRGGTGGGERRASDSLLSIGNFLGGAPDKAQVELQKIHQTMRQLLEETRRSGTRAIKFQ